MVAMLSDTTIAYMYVQRYNLRPQLYGGPCSQCMLPPLFSRFEPCSLYHEATTKLINSENPHLLCETLCVSLPRPVRALSNTRMC